MATMGPAGILLFTRPPEHPRPEPRNRAERRPTREARAAIRELRRLTHPGRGKNGGSQDANKAPARQAGLVVTHERNR